MPDTGPRVPADIADLIAKATAFADANTVEDFRALFRGVPQQGMFAEGHADLVRAAALGTMQGLLHGLAAVLRLELDRRPAPDADLCAECGEPVTGPLHDETGASACEASDAARAAQDAAAEAGDLYE